MEKLGIRDVTLMDGERIEASLNLGDGRPDLSSRDTDALLLTDRRIIHLHAKSPGRKAVFASLQDINAAEIRTESNGYSGYVWGGLAFVVAALLWQVWDQPLVSPLAAAAVAMMGVYLIVDHKLSPPRMRATFQAGSATLECEVNDRASEEIYPFVNRLFHLKEERDGRADAAPARRGFSPR
jgi:hypothetical protein